jgi:hypothetical protein
LSAAQFKFTFRVSEINIRDMRGKLNTVSGAREESYNPVYVVRGDRITFKAIPLNGFRPCSFDLKANKNASIEGTMACEDGDFQGPVQLEAQMF